MSKVKKIKQEEKFKSVFVSPDHPFEQITDDCTKRSDQELEEQRNPDRNKIHPLVDTIFCDAMSKNKTTFILE